PRAHIPAGRAAPYENMAAPGAAALVQYVVLRGDLARSWPLGAVVAQGCHAALVQAAVLGAGSSPVTTWLHSRPSLSQAPDEAALMALAETLKQHSIDHEVWTEQPENTATCLALRPYPKDQVHQHLKKFKLLK
ncbi:PTRD1 hydrolase, partial [Upupa epops]|nr:PTRD1 hydrolase [Upupa epops]